MLGHCLPFKLNQSGGPCTGTLGAQINPRVPHRKALPRAPCTRHGFYSTALRSPPPNYTLPHQVSLDYSSPQHIKDSLISPTKQSKQFPEPHNTSRIVSLVPLSNLSSFRSPVQADEKNPQTHTYSFRPELKYTLQMFVFHRICFI